MEVLRNVLLMLAVLVSAACAAVPQPVLDPPARENHETICNDMGVLARSNPYYPREAYNARQNGWALVEVVVGEQGQVVSAKSIDASPPGVFDAASEAAISKWRFRPTKETFRCFQVVQYELR
jgi:protein TonB